MIDFDLPGYGESRGPIKDQSIESLADQVAEFISTLGYDKVHVHGTSFGAMIGLTAAAMHPDIIDRLVLSCFLARYDRAARMMRATWKRAAKESGMDAVADLTSVAGFAREFYETDWAQAQLRAMRTAFSATDPKAFVAATEAIERADLSPLIDRIMCPTMLLAGQEDNMTPFEPAASGVGMAEISSHHPAWQRHIVQGSGHYLVLEQPATVASLINDFLCS